MKIRYSDGMKYLGVWPLVGVVPLSHGHYREMWWTPKQKGSVRKGRKERSFGHFHIMSFHFCVCLFKAYDIFKNKYPILTRIGCLFPCMGTALPYTAAYPGQDGVLVIHIDPNIFKEG